jgi:hypothetical protein
MIFNKNDELALIGRVENPENVGNPILLGKRPKKR